MFVYRIGSYKRIQDLQGTGGLYVAGRWHQKGTRISQLTEHWLTEAATWIMQVPSAQSPTEYNYLLNPQHPEHDQLRVVAVDDELFDQRLKR